MLSLSAMLVAAAFTQEAKVPSGQEYLQLLYFRAIKWLTLEHKAYGFRLVRRSGESCRGETVTVTRKQIREWLETGMPPEIAKSQLENTPIRKRLGVENEIHLDDAFHDLRSAILKNSVLSCIKEEHVQEWVASGKCPKKLRGHLMTALGFTEQLDEILQKLREEIMQIEDE